MSEACGLSLKVAGRKAYKVFRGGTLVGSIRHAWAYASMWTWFTPQGVYGNAKTRHAAIDALARQPKT